MPWQKKFQVITKTLLDFSELYGIVKQDRWHKQRRYFSLLTLRCCSVDARIRMIALTRTLEVSYLSIDKLCITQDSEEELSETGGGFSGSSTLFVFSM